MHIIGSIFEMTKNCEVKNENDDDADASELL